MNSLWHLYVMAILYIIAGINHFRVPRLYQKIIPSYLPNPSLLNILTGVIEIALGISLLIPAISRYAAWGIILLLIAVFPTHIFMLTNPKASMGLPKWVLYLRLPLQLLLLYWAYSYTE
ncbi:MAG: MauE/DoxX family redox-associated membrane protein [Flavobacterium sp.]